MNRTIHLISSLRRGGRERQLATLYSCLKKEGHTLQVVCMNYSKESYVDEYSLGQDIVYLKSKNPIGRLVELIKMVKAHNCKIVWSWGGYEATYGLLISWFTVVRHINGSIRHGILSPKMSQYWRMIVLQLSRYRVANSRIGLKANFLKKGFVWYNGLAESFLKEPEISVQDKLRNELEITRTNDKPILFSVANLVPYKDYLTILRGLIQLKNSGIPFYYLIVGEGPERSNIEQFISQNNLKKKVRLLGRRSDIKELLSISDIFIHSSKGEGCSNAIIEAMAAGKPIIATSTGGTPEIVSNNGLLFNLGDSDTFYQQIKSMVINKPLIAEMGKRSYELARTKFSIERMIEEYLYIIDHVSQGLKINKE